MQNRGAASAAKEKKCGSGGKKKKKKPQPKKAESDSDEDLRFRRMGGGCRESQRSNPRDVSKFDADKFPKKEENAGENARAPPKNDRPNRKPTNNNRPKTDKNGSSTPETPAQAPEPEANDPEESETEDNSDAGSSPTGCTSSSKCSGECRNSKWCKAKRKGRDRRRRLFASFD